ncbi:MAG: 1-phosphofructokinase [Cyanobacteria bacterium Co-bin8]|nr:1-phosphofructokinase [Cyanobacteria bacterium Co-bin8]
MTCRIATVTPNPAIDQTVAIANFAANAVNRVDWEQSDAGGKGINVASFLADFDQSVSVTGFLGQDNLELFRRLFEQKGICDRSVAIAGKTRVNIKIVDDAQQQVTDINFPGAVPQPSDVEALWGAVDELAADHDWFVLSGSLPQGLPVTLYWDLVSHLKRIGKTVVLDTSGEPLKAALAARPDLIKPNLSELQDLLGHPLESEADILQAASELLQRGLRWVVVSMGAEGAYFVTAAAAFHAQPPPTEVKSTVGAGDAMVAGTVAGLVQGADWADCARLGTAFSLSTLGLLGPHLTNVETVRGLCDRIKLRSLTLPNLALKE